MFASVRPMDNKALNYQVNSEFINPTSYSVSPMLRYQIQNSTLTTGVNYAVNSTDYNTGANLSYTGPRTILQTTYAQSSSGGSTKTLRMDSALAFVGKRWGISSPIRNSFALLYANNDAMTDSTIIFNNGSVLDRLSTAVYPTLANYQTQGLSIEMADVPVGLDLGSQQYILTGELNSGQAIPVGKPGGILMASMFLLTPEGKPYELKVGTMVSIEDPQLTVQFFTNRQGKLFVQGLRAGEYRVELLGDTFADFTITVPKSKEILIDLGRVTLEPNTE